MSFLLRLFSTRPSITMSEAKNKAELLIRENPVMVFSKSYCPYCRATKKTLQSLGAEFKVYEMNEESDGSAIQDALEKEVAIAEGQRSVPNIFIGGKHIGGNDSLHALSQSDLKAKLQAVGALS